MNPKNNQSISTNRKNMSGVLNGEDQQLKSAIGKYGDQKWPEISSAIPGRTSKQCRERWKNKLDPNIRSDPLTKEEIEKLENLLKLYGRQWSIISNLFPNRSDNILKNYYFSKQRAQNRINKMGEESKTRTHKRNNNPRKRCKNNKDLNEDSKKKQKVIVYNTNVNKTNKDIKENEAIKDRTNVKKKKILIFPVVRKKNNPIFLMKHKNDEYKDLQTNNKAKIDNNICISYFGEGKEKKKFTYNYSNREIIDYGNLKLESNFKPVTPFDPKEQKSLTLQKNNIEMELNTPILQEKRNHQQVNQKGNVDMGLSQELFFAKKINFNYYPVHMFVPIYNDNNIKTEIFYNEWLPYTECINDTRLINLDLDLDSCFTNFGNSDSLFL
ncbi:myb protein [Anaeramoeba flamelloides]|uniref:Myb protein n=1 Tax=Anaeramoeba flamelloides TaxID=1746091 RepID=A0ABQ8XV65_9EUKA|nr:myb protein [Anaeramoeba flamelloides]